MEILTRKYTQQMTKIKEAFVKEVMRQYVNEQISFSRMVEMLNEEANRDITAQEAGVFSQQECPFQYCPTPEICKSGGACNCSTQKSSK